jgi:hypothetical protein
MAKLAALAPGPIPFTDSNGDQVEIPVSLAYFEDGVPKFTPPTGMSPGTATAIGNWLLALAAEGVLRPGAASPPVPAMVINAKSPGSQGNTITVTIANVRPKPGDASKTVFDAQVAESDVYELLTPATLEAVLGTSATNGQQPGLAFVSSAGAPALPKNGTYPLNGDPATVDIPKADGSPGGFSLRSKAGGTDAALTTATVSRSDDPEHPGTFMLQLTWKKATAAAIEPGGLGTTFAYEISVDPPAGGTLAAPAPGTYGLGGGADARAAEKASATIPAGA